MSLSNSSNTNLQLAYESLSKDASQLAELYAYLSEEEQRALQHALAHIRTPKMSLGEFSRHAWNVIEPSTPYSHNWHIDAIVDHLTAVTWGEIKYLVINIPPRHMKSTLVSVFWQPWVWTFRPESRWLFYSHSLDNPIRDTRKARMIINSQFYQEAFGDVFTLSHDQNVKSWFTNNVSGQRRAVSVMGSVGAGGDFIVGDDMLDMSKRHSATERQNVNDQWTTTIMSRRNDPKDSPMVIIAQRLHENDIAGWVKQKEDEGGPKYEYLVIPAEYEQQRYYTSIGWTDPRTKFGELMWPNRFDRDSIDRIKKATGPEYAALYQQQPSPAEGDIFKRSTIKFWIPAGMTGKIAPYRMKGVDGKMVAMPHIELPPDFDEVCQSWDTAFEENETSSFVVGQVWGKHQANVFLLDQVRDHMDIARTMMELANLSASWPQSTAKYIEKKASGTFVIQLMNQAIAGLIPVVPKGSKEVRARGVSHFFHSGNIYLPHPAIATWVVDFIDEMLKFPNGANDDQIDAMSQALGQMVIGEAGAPPPVIAKRNVSRDDFKKRGFFGSR